MAGPVLLGALCGVLSAQTPPVPASVSGVVTNSVTGEPVLRAHVAVRGMGSPSPDTPPQSYGALTNQEGKFTIAPLPAGRYVVSVERVGFVMPINSNSQGRLADITLAAGDKKEDLKLTLTPTGAIVGRVLDSAGEPVPSAMVQVEGNNDNQNVSTDEQGRYRAGGLRPGKYRVHATPPGSPFPAEIRTDGTEIVHYSATYYPESLDRASARRVEVGAAADVNGVDIRLIRTAVLSVTGKVDGMPGGKARANLMVMREGEQGASSANAMVKQDGSFKISPIDPGKYTITALVYGPSPQHNLQSPPVEIEVAGANVEHIELRLIPPFDVSGQVRFDDEAARTPPQRPAQPGQAASTRQQMPPRQINLQPGAGFMGNGGLSAAIGADDSFTLESVVPGRYHVSLSWGPAYVSAVRVGETVTEGDVLDVRNGPAGAVTLTVSSATCQISGTVNDSSGPVANAHVILVPQAGEVMFTRSTSAKPDGTYTFTGLRPGKYQLAAVDEGFYPNGRSDNALEDYEDVAARIELRAGDKLTQDLKRK